MCSQKRMIFKHLNNNFKVDMYSTIKELLIFLRNRKKLWLSPVIIVIVIVGFLLVVAQGSVLAPFIYTLF
jgi:uncharacterized membrane protein